MNSIDTQTLCNWEETMIPLGATLGAAVNTIGDGTTVIQTIRISSGALIVTGAAVVPDVSEDGRVVGVPAKEM